MRVPRVPLERELAIDHEAALSDDQAHHLLRVLRLPDGAALRLFNGAPGDWHARLVVRGKRRAAALVTAFEPRATEPDRQLTLVQGISRGQRMDYTLEKSVELGVTAIAPVVMARTQAAPTGERAQRKARHWRGVVQAAAAQAGRTRIPSLAEPLPWSQWLAEAPGPTGPCVLLDPDADQAPADLAVERGDALTLLAGPEGGFAPGEREAAYAAGFHGIRLGPRILRTETAAVAALALLQGLHGDLR